MAARHGLPGGAAPGNPYFTVSVPFMIVGCTSHRKKYFPAASLPTEMLPVVTPVTMFPVA